MDNRESSDGTERNGDKYETLMSNDLVNGKGGRKFILAVILESPWQAASSLCACGGLGKQRWVVVVACKNSLYSHMPGGASSWLL